MPLAMLAARRKKMLIHDVMPYAVRQTLRENAERAAVGAYTAARCSAHAFYSSGNGCERCVADVCR